MLLTDFLAAHPGAAELVVILGYLVPALVIAAGKENTKWGHFAVSLMGNVIGAMRGRRDPMLATDRVGDPKPPVDMGPPAAGAAVLCLALTFGAVIGCAHKALVHDVSQLIADLTAASCAPKDSVDDCLGKVGSMRAAARMQGSSDAASSLIGAVGVMPDAGGDGARE